MDFNIVTLSGDGIGPEIVAQGLFFLIHDPTTIFFLPAN